jgi:hypothetical protein
MAHSAIWSRRVISWSLFPAMQHKSIIAMYLLQIYICVRPIAHIGEGSARQKQLVSEPKILQRIYKAGKKITFYGYYHWEKCNLASYIILLSHQPPFWITHSGHEPK